MRKGEASGTEVRRERRPREKETRMRRRRSSDEEVCKTTFGVSFKTHAYEMTSRLSCTVFNTIHAQMTKSLRSIALLLFLFMGCFNPVNGFFFPPSVRLETMVSLSRFSGKVHPWYFQVWVVRDDALADLHHIFAFPVENPTVVVLNGADAVTASIVEDVAETLAVDRVGFVSHSSFDSNILLSDRVADRNIVRSGRSAVLRLGKRMGASGRTQSRQNLRAGLAYDASRTTPIPEFLSPKVSPDSRRSCSTMSVTPIFWTTRGPRSGRVRYPLRKE